MAYLEGLDRERAASIEVLKRPPPSACVCTVPACAVCARPCVSRCVSGGWNRRGERQTWRSRSSSNRRCARGCTTPLCDWISVALTAAIDCIAQTYSNPYEKIVAQCDMKGGGKKDVSRMRAVLLELKHNPKA